MSDKLLFNLFLFSLAVIYQAKRPAIVTTSLGFAFTLIAALSAIQGSFAFKLSLTGLILSALEC